MLRPLSLAMLALVACSNETQLSGEAPPAQVFNPPALEANAITDRIVQFPRPAVDILFVVDNSGSMEDEQVTLGENFPVFLDYFLGAGVDYHIGVTSTDTEVLFPRPKGRLVEAMGYRWIDEETENPEQVFTAMTSLGTDGSSSEMGRGNVHKALEENRDAFNAGFLRDRAALHIIFVSDEDDDSGTPFSQVLSKEEFIRWMHGLKYDRSLVRAHGIVNLDDGACAGEIGTAYQQYATATDGLLESICEPDWSPFMDALGVEATGLLQEVMLSRRPTLDSIAIEVRYDEPTTGQPIVLGPELWHVCWTRDEHPDCNVLFRSQRNSIVFLDFTPPPGAEVIVSYEAESL